MPSSRGSSRRVAGLGWAAIRSMIAWVALTGCGRSEGRDPATEPLLAVLSAMPGELAPNLAGAELVESVALAGRDVRLGSLEGVPVVLAMTGIGTVNAASVASAVLDAFPVTGVVVSGVAHSSLRIADVTVVENWTTADGNVFGVDDGWLAAARDLAASGAVALPRCSEDPPARPDSPICVDHDPRIVVGGVGHTSDPFGGAPLPCIPGGGGVFGCGPPPEVAADASSARTTTGDAALTGVAVQDMESAMIAREADARGLPFIAFRGTSDSAAGTIDSLSEFFHYYGLAADTASRAARAFLHEIPR